jgi:hypothetical protein
MPKLIAVTLVLIAACGDNYSSLSLDEYPAALRDAFCSAAVACGDVIDLETCRRTSLGQPAPVSARDRAAIAAGTIVFRGDDALACADALARRSCDVTSQSSRVLPDACFTVLVGTQGDGAACTRNLECVSQVCDAPACDGACCPGTCVGDAAPVRAQVGASCEAARCVDAAFCDEAALCVARKAAGGTCIVSDNCQFGLDCDPDGSCGALPALGEPCAGACRDQGTTCSPISQTCVAVALAGAPCAMSSDCSVFYVCDATKHCGLGVALGEPCSVGQHCADPGAFCAAAPGESLGVCAPARQVGEPCTQSTDCATQTCDLDAEVCAEEPVCP